MDRLTLAAITYEECRKKVQRGYSLVKFKDGELVMSPQVKQLKAVVDWLHDSGWNFNFDDMGWKGYWEFCFAKFAPRVPFPGQLKNPVLLKEYLNTYTEREEKMEVVSPKLVEMYKKRLRPEIAGSQEMLYRLGLI